MTATRPAPSQQKYVLAVFIVLEQTRLHNIEIEIKINECESGKG